MSDNSQKIPLGQSLNRFAEQKAVSAIQKLGKSLPCTLVAVSGSIVTVSFDVVTGFTLPNVTCPAANSEYERPPYQVGDRGVVMSIDTYLGGISGLGGGNASLAQRANLSNLIYFPIANAAWDPPDNPNAYLVQGPDGVVIKAMNGATTITIDSEGNVVVAGAKSFSTDVNGYGQRLTWIEDNKYNLDTYYLGAVVTEIPHAWNPPNIPAPGDE